jgi:hypothetical protein
MVIRELHTDEQLAQAKEESGTQLAKPPSLS